MADTSRVTLGGGRVAAQRSAYSVVLVADVVAVRVVLGGHGGGVAVRYSVAAAENGVALVARRRRVSLGCDCKDAVDVLNVDD
jgi:hypothetical protein